MFVTFEIILVFAIAMWLSGFMVAWALTSRSNYPELNEEERE